MLDLGAGPGRDGEAFGEAGLRFIGVDLAHGNGVLAAEVGVTVVQGSVSAPPFRPRCFDAGWSMSTLMHVPDAELAETVTAMTSPLRPGSPLLLGMWGGEQGDVIDESGIDGERRSFALRPIDRNREALESIGMVEHESIWDVGPENWHYQVFRIRISDR